MPNTSMNLYETGKSKFLLFLIIEKVYRLRKHITTVYTKNFLKEKSYELFLNCLKEIFFLTTKSYNRHCSSIECDEKQLAVEFTKIVNLLISFDKNLSVIPKSEAPVEIYRFLRIFDKNGIASLDGKDVEFILHSSDDSDLRIYRNTPIEDFEENFLHECRSIILGADNINLSQPKQGESNKEFYHICIPRELLEPPLYWPILAHEIGHQVMLTDMFSEENIYEEFIKFAQINEENYPNSLKYLLKKGQKCHGTASQKNLKEILTSWLTECWCDIYSYFVMGSSVLYAQRNMFILCELSSKSKITATHPPNFLRILVLYLISSQHQGDEKIDNFFSNNYQQFFEDDDQQLLDAIFDAAQFFGTFFGIHFKTVPVDYNKLNEHIEKIKSQFTHIDLNILANLKDRLAQFLPVPSYRYPKSLYESETTISEIMTAAWLAYDDEIFNLVINKFDELVRETNAPDASESWNLIFDNLNLIFDKFNLSILKSLQTSEWVELFKPTECPITLPAHIAINSEDKDVEKKTTSILNDSQIIQALHKDELKILPLINIDKQLGSTSLDVRLGTSFQIYQSNQSGIIDFCDDESVKTAQFNSTFLDVDFGKGFVVAPGQFVLAHTLEYICLPDYLSAQLEGRSSFARLGIEIHMTASFIDPGFAGTITFEIYNAGPNPIKLFPGYRIGQLRFFPCNPPQKPYNAKHGAKYRGLLEHSASLLSKDYEVDRLKKYYKNFCK